MILCQGISIVITHTNTTQEDMLECINIGCKAESLPLLHLIKDQHVTKHCIAPLFSYNFMPLTKNNIVEVAAGYGKKHRLGVTIAIQVSEVFLQCPVMRGCCHNAFVLLKIHVHEFDIVFIQHYNSLGKRTEPQTCSSTVSWQGLQQYIVPICSKRLSVCKHYRILIKCQRILHQFYCQIIVAACYDFML